MAMIEDTYSAATADSSPVKDSDPSLKHSYQQTPFKRDPQNRLRSSFGKGLRKLRRTRSTSESNLCKSFVYTFC